MNGSISSLRRDIFSRDWPLDADITRLASTLPSHNFLENPSGQLAYIYLTQFVRAFAERHAGRPFSDLMLLDWGCGKGHVSKLIQEMGPGRLDSCDVLSERDDSASGQKTPIFKEFGIAVKALEHDYILPYEDSAFDVVLSVGVLEHVPNDRASLLEIKRVLCPGGLFFCFFLPTKFSWTQAVSRQQGNDYHDRLYTKPQVQEMLNAAGLTLMDFWYRQLLPKNSVVYPSFRSFEKLDQFMTEHSPLRHFATNVEFVCMKPNLAE